MCRARCNGRRAIGPPGRRPAAAASRRRGRPRWPALLASAAEFSRLADPPRVRSAGSRRRSGLVPRTGRCSRWPGRPRHRRRGDRHRCVPAPAFRTPPLRLPSGMPFPRTRLGVRAASPWRWSRCPAGRARRTRGSSRPVPLSRPPRHRRRRQIDGSWRPRQRWTERGAVDLGAPHVDPVNPLRVGDVVEGIGVEHEKVRFFPGRERSHLLELQVFSRAARGRDDRPAWASCRP